MNALGLLNEVGREISCKGEDEVHAIVLWYEVGPDGAWKWHMKSANMNLPETIALLQLGVHSYTEMFRNNQPEPYTVQ